jgi:hypothetical protein
MEKTRGRAPAWAGRLTYQVLGEVVAMSVSAGGKVTRETTRVAAGKTEGLSLLQPASARKIIFQDPYRAIGLIAAGAYDRHYTKAQLAAARRDLLAEVRRFPR